MTQLFFPIYYDLNNRNPKNEKTEQNNGSVFSKQQEH